MVSGTESKKDIGNMGTIKKGGLTSSVIASAINLLELAERLLEIRPAANVMPIVERALDLYPFQDFYQPSGTENQYHTMAGPAGELPEDLDAAVDHVAGLLSRELDDMRQRLAPWAASYYIDLSFYLGDDDKLLIPGEDSLLFSLRAPVDICQKAGNRPALEPDKVKKLVLDNLPPPYQPDDLARIRSIWGDAGTTLIIGCRINPDKPSFERLSLEQSKALISNIAKASSPETPPALTNIPEENRAAFRLLNKIILLLQEVEKALTDPATSKESFASMIRELSALFNLNKLEEAFDTDPRSCGSGEENNSAAFGDAEYRLTGNLDQALRATESEVATLIENEKNNLAARNSRLETRLTDWELPMSHTLTFWSEQNGRPLPFWSSKTSLIDLFTSSEDWSETHPFKPMCCLSHTVFVDGLFPHEWLHSVRYVTWEMDFVRQFEIHVDK